jgi:hypothetical protein
MQKMTHEWTWCKRMSRGVEETRQRRKLLSSFPSFGKVSSLHPATKGFEHGRDQVQRQILRAFDYYCDLSSRNEIVAEADVPRGE